MKHPRSVELVIRQDLSYKEKKIKNKNKKQLR